MYICNLYNVINITSKKKKKRAWPFFGFCQINQTFQSAGDSIGDRNRSSHCIALNKHVRNLYEASLLPKSLLDYGHKDTVAYL